jgi:glutamate dehydrogenase
LRTLGDLGLTVIDDTQVPLTLPSGRRAFLYKLEVEAPVARVSALRDGFERFLDALRALDEARATEDALGGLILDANLTWRQVEVLRTLRNHLLQVRSHYNVETVNRVLLRNAGVAAALFRAFAARFDPAEPGTREAAMAAATASLRQTLETVQSLPEDEVLRAFVNLINSSLRTNFYQRPERPVIAVKVDSSKVDGMISPRPMFEIYVHSRLLEGIHLRGGKVARGGIRWSDRHDDFRTEILGLMKTQMVKNSIIVPVGSKGGFVLKGDVPPRPALDAYLIDRYREFISGLLDVTDNIVDGQILHPPDVVRHDGDDPYLVVAADKGTAHLSDTANSVSGQYGFWLGDAFASGGGAGYDHKKMGITAKGAWECVRHHFHLLGHDIQKQPFTAVGIGDMAGDVFGNGALLSPVLRLVAAFNHVHIFIDPDPDPQRSFKERERLFHLPRSTWRDYDTSLISAGGGVFDRAARAIPVSPQMRAVLDLEGETATGEEVIRKILSARVDLLYNGGIGTYIKAAGETDAQVADRANDRVRVTAPQVRARVIGEGGNLGLTQKGRLEYWAGGGLLNTDAVDNSGGVDTSDHEVNIKILMGVLIKKGVVKGRGDRDGILREMTDEVAELVLADNRNQARAITLDNLRSRERYEEFVAFIEDLVATGVLSRADESIPGREELLSSPQRDRGLPRPLLAVLLGYVKMRAFQRLLETDFPDSPEARPWLDAYFPASLERFREHFAEHTLRREIIATVAINRLVNEAGVTFLWRLTNDTQAELGALVAAWLDCERRGGASELRTQIERSDLGADAANRLLLELEAQLEAQTRTALAGEPGDAAHALDALRARVSRGGGQ